MALGDDEKPRWPAYLAVRDTPDGPFADPVDLQLQSAREALTLLALIRGFDREDLLLIASAAMEDKKWADDLAANLEEETGIRFHLTVRQWGVIHAELGGT